MRKIICLLLCVAMCCILLVGCVDEPIGADLDDYDEYRKDDSRSKAVLDFYIVSDTTNADTKSTITREINAYLKPLYNTELRIEFISASEYATKLQAGVTASGDARADIVLITSKSMFDGLYGSTVAENKLVALDKFLNSKDFGRLNSPDIIATALLDASTAPDGNKYVIPNNRVAGEYEYYLVSKDVARYFCESELDFKLMEYEIPALPEALADFYETVKQIHAALAAFEVVIEDYDKGLQYTTPVLNPTDVVDDYVTWLKGAVIDISGAQEPAEAGKFDGAIEKLDAEIAEFVGDGKDEAYKDDEVYKSLAAIKAQFDELKSLANKCNKSYTDRVGENSYESLYELYLEEKAGYTKFVEFKARYEKLVADNYAELKAASASNPNLDPDKAYLTHEDIGTDYYSRLQYLDTYFCINSNPYVSAEEAHESSFAIIAQGGTEAEEYEHAYRCMEVIYSLDTDPVFKNLLQYGVRNTHYEAVDIYLDEAGNILGEDVDGGFEKDGKIYKVNAEGRYYLVNDEGETIIDEATGKPVETGKAIKGTMVLAKDESSSLNYTHHMNILYTGGLFNAYYNEYTDGNAWTAPLANAGKIQNNEALAK